METNTIDDRALDSALQQTFPASDPLPPGAAIAAEKAIDPPRSTAPQAGPLVRLLPGITSMVRMDHTHVTLMAHRYRADIADSRKLAIVRTVGIALEIHAQLEEEIFYPALAEVDPDDQTLAKSKPEHDEMRRLLRVLRGMAPDREGYDERFAELMREVQHHVADEENVLLPRAERLLAGRLETLGLAMTKRRVQLLLPHLGRIAVDSAVIFPGLTALAAIGVSATAYLALRRRD